MYGVFAKFDFKWGKNKRKKKKKGQVASRMR
jgi:hypothetical protein